MAPRHRARVAILAALGAALLVLVVPALAAAHTYVVNSTADPVPGVRAGCESAPEAECTLRGAVEASNANPAPTGEQNIVNFDSTFEGVAGNDEVVLSEPLHVSQPVAIAGNVCPEPTTHIDKPCVGVVGPAGAAADFEVMSHDVSFYFLAIGGAKVGIEAVATDDLRVAGDWFGLNLAGQAKGLSEAGIVLGHGYGAVIGQDGSGSEPAVEEAYLRNVFTHSKVGVSMIATRHSQVEGNYIGVGPDGKTLAGVSVGVQVSDESVTEESNVIGGELTGAQAGSAACDGPCNVIATGGPGAVGIRLGEAAGGSYRSPKGPTSIYGNYIGLSADGKTQVGEAEYGILAAPTPGTTVGPANVTVGGPRTPESALLPFRNVIDGGDVAVRVERAEGFLAEANAIGRLPGDEAIPEAGPDSAAFELVPAGVTERPKVAHNTIFLPSGATGVASIGRGSQILVNSIYYGLTGVILAEDDGGMGNTVQGNLIDEPEWFGIEVENDSNVLTGNWIFEADRAGIVLGGEHGVYASHNRIGGDTAAEENRIEGCPEGTIQIVGEPNDHNEVAGNWGTSAHEPGVGHPFIQLIGHTSAEPPNGGIAPPTIVTAEESRVSGTAEPGAKVRLFPKRTADPGELQSLIATVVADSTGHWVAIPTEKLALGTFVAATQTTEAGTPEAATSEVSTPMATVADHEDGGAGGGTGGGGTGGGSGGSGDSGGSGSSGSTSNPTPISTPAPAKSKAPEVTITKSPKKISEATTATFKFKAEPGAGAKFECKLDGAKWATCRPPKTLNDLKPGKHTFRVRAKANGLTGPVTKYRFTVKT